MPFISPPPVTGNLPGVLSTGFGQVASRGWVSSSASNGTDLKTTSRSRHYLPNQCSDIRLVYANVICTTGGLETAATTPITVTAALEYPQGVVNPMTFNGQTSIIIPAGSIVVSDPCGLDFAAGSVVWPRQCVAQGGTTVWPTNTQSVFNGGNAGADGDGFGGKVTNATNAAPIVISTSGNHNLTTGDQVTISGVAGNTAANGTFTATKVSATTFSLNTTTGNGAYTGGGQILGLDLTLAGSAVCIGSGGTNMFAPSAIIGRLPYGVKQPYAVILGDSIAAGTGDTSNSSWIIRALGGALTPTVPYVMLAISGTLASQFADSANYPTQSEKRRKLGMGAPYVFVPYGTNDFASRTLAQLQADQLAICSSVQTRGGRAIVATLFPKTTTTDSWTTSANQTVTANEAIRTGYNDWVRAGCPIVAGVAVAAGTAGALLAGSSSHPVWSTINPCVYVEANAANALTVNGGRWLATGSANGPTSDGVHPSSAYHILAAQALSVTSLVAF